MRSTLRSNIQEHFLWHGISPQGTCSICSTGFEIDKAPKGIYGKSLYFAECSSKSDEYASLDAVGELANCRALLLCRVALGQVLVWEQTRVINYGKNGIPASTILFLGTGRISEAHIASLFCQRSLRQTCFPSVHTDLQMAVTRQWCISKVCCGGDRIITSLGLTHAHPVHVLQSLHESTV